MTSNEAEAVGRRIALHLRKNNFMACHDILVTEEQQLSSPEQITAIAELPIPLGCVNFLEGAGYIYLADLVGVDVTELEIKELGPISKNIIKKALQRWKADKRDAEVRELKEAEKAVEEAKEREGKNTRVKMSPRQRKFVSEYCKTNSVTSAMKAAGYKVPQ